MSEQPSIKKNFIMNSLLTMSSFLFPLITFPYVSRILLPEGTGKVALATSVVSYFNMFAQLGIPTYGIRACAQVRDSREELTRTVHELLFINLVMSAFAYACLFLAICFLPKFRQEKALYCVVSITIILTAIGMDWMYQGLEQYTYITVRSVVFKLIALLGMFLLVHSKDDYVIYGGITIFAASASNVLNFINAHKYIDMHPIGKYHPWRHMKAILVFFAMACATTVYTNLDVVMLGWLKTDEDVGYYNAAVRIKSMLVSIITSLGSVLLPRASYYIEEKAMDKFRAISKKAINFVLVFSIPLMVYFMIYASYGIYFLSGRAYTNSILPMQCIMPTLVFIGLSYTIGLQMLVPLGHEKTVLYSEIAGAAVDFIINFLLIPKFASVGAAIGTAVAEFVVLIVQYVAYRKDLKFLFQKIHFPSIVLAILLSVGASWWVTMLHLGNFLTLLMTAIFFFAVYGGVLYVLKEPFTVSVVNQELQKIKKKSSSKRRG